MWKSQYPQIWGFNHWKPKAKQSLALTLCHKLWQNQLPFWYHRGRNQHAPKHTVAMLRLIANWPEFSLPQFMASVTVLVIYRPVYSTQVRVLNFPSCNVVLLTWLMLKTIVRAQTARWRSQSAGCYRHLLELNFQPKTNMAESNEANRNGLSWSNLLGKQSK